MHLEPSTTRDIVRRLITGTTSGTIKWEPEFGDTDVFRTNFKTGGVRLCRVVVFSLDPDGPLLLELLDPAGRSRFQFRPQSRDDIALLEELFGLASRRALNPDQSIDALLEEIKGLTTAT